MKSLVSMRVLWRRVALVAVTLTGGGVFSGSGTGGRLATVVVVVDGVGLAVFAGGLKYSGSTFGAAQAHSQRKPIEIRTAVKIRFSISRDGVPTSRIEDVAAR